MSRYTAPWMSPPAIVQPFEAPTIRPLDMQKVEAAFRHAVEHAICVVGIEGLKRTSMFPSSSRRLAQDAERADPVPHDE